MRDYKIIDRVIDLFAFLGLYCLLAYAWETVEMWLYGFSQKSVVDSVFAALFCAFVIVFCRAWSIAKQEEERTLT